MAFNMRFRKRINVKRVVSKIAFTVIALYVGGTVLTEVGGVMNGTASPFYKGLTLIGWKLGGSGETGCAGVTDETQICNTTANTGVLAVVGIVAIAAIVLEFIQFSW